MKILNRVVPVLVVVGILYHLVYVLYPLQAPKEHLNNHLAFALILTFVLTLQKTRKRWPLTLLLLALSLITTGYMKVFYWDLEARLGSPVSADTIIGIILLVVVLETCRQIMGLTLVVVALLSIGYAFLGSYLPRPFYFPRFDPDMVISFLTTSFEGTHGMLLEVSAYYIFLFVIMGGVMQVTGASQFINAIGILMGKLLRGGPAMTAVIGSSLVGTMSGSSAANIVITGTYTIPLMKKVGYKPAEAGAIEAAASNGGQIMPPVMGAAAFVMSRITGIPYPQIIVAAAIPAIFYYISVGMYVQLVAMKRNVRAGEALGEVVNIREMLLSSLGFVLPLGIILVLFVQGYSPMYVAFWAVIASIALGLARRAPWKEWIQGLTNGASTGATIAISTATCGIIVKVLTMTGLGTKLPIMVEAASGGNLLLALIFTMLVSVILGTGVPTTPAYIIVAIMAAPVLVRLGLSLISAHMFVFFFAVMSMVTPPVAPAAIVASQVAGAGYFKTAVESCKAALVGFLIPFIFVMQPVFLAQASSLAQATAAIVAALIMLLSAQIAMVGQYFTTVNPVERALFFLSGLALFVFCVILNSYLLFAGAIVLFFLLSLAQIRKRQSLRTEASRVQI